MEQRSSRSMAVIVSLDLVGYSRLMEQDEIGTHRALMACMQDRLLPIVRGHRGEIVKPTGDGAILRFPEAALAVNAMIHFQRDITAGEEVFPESRRLVFRIGIHLGPAIDDCGDVYGHGVNLAVRLQEVAEPGSIFLSGAIVDRLDVSAKSSLGKVGWKALKNIKGYTEIYCWRQGRRSLSVRPSKIGGLVAAMLLINMAFPTVALNRLETIDELERRHDVPRVERLTKRDGWAVPYRGLAGQPLEPGIRTTMAATERGLENRREIAEDSYLQALALYDRHTPKAFAQAVELLDDALALRPGYGDAHALLAAVYWSGQQNRWQIGQGLTRLNMLNRARRHLSRAASPNPISHMVRSEMLTASGRHERAILEAGRALQLDATRGVGHYALGRALLFAGRAAEAETPLRKAVRLDPKASRHLFTLALAQFSLDRFGDAERTLVWTTAQNSDDDWPHILMAATQGHLGMSSRARNAIGRFDRLSLERRGWFASQIPYVHRWPFLNREDSERFHVGMVLAGMPDVRR
jgi:class 3 adenylate cyclase/tetratricopeptide (TPR) repeat protein